MKPEEAGVVLDALVAAFPHVRMSEETVRIYARFISDADVEPAIAAVARWIARERRFPSIADLRTEIAYANGTAAPDLDQAWEEVRKSFSSSRAPKWSHPAIAAAVNALGYHEIGQSTEPGVTRAHFQRAYEAASKRMNDPTHAQLVASVRGEVLALVGAARRELKP